ncbi:hypothetical protein V1477_001323 [Vespula maculifrons]|uniref:Uncharacterized protein n=1 Tax=Vespula maculifrons TaxID=7453 RepID=A0ABD2AKL9_VESMC
MFFLSYPYSRLAIDYETDLWTIYRTLADILKSMKKRRSRREREPEHARTWSEPKPEYQNRVGFFDTERRRPAQKPTPMSPTHGTLPRE